MIQPTATPATVVNQNATGVSVASPGTNEVTANNQVTATVTISAPQLTTARVEGLWMSFNLPWEMTEPWSYVSLVQSNTAIQNI